MIRNLHRGLVAAWIVTGLAAIVVGVLASLSLPGPNEYRFLGVFMMIAAFFVAILASLVTLGHVLILSRRRGGGYVVSIFSALPLGVTLFGTFREAWPITLFGPNLITVFLAVNLWSGIRAIRHPL